MWPISDGQCDKNEGIFFILFMNHFIGAPLFPCRPAESLLHFKILGRWWFPNHTLTHTHTYKHTHTHTHTRTMTQGGWLDLWWPIYTAMNSSTFSQQRRVHALFSMSRWIGTQFGRPCWSVHGSGRVCLGPSGSRSRCCLTGILGPHGALPQALTHLGEARFIALGLRYPFFRGMPTGPEALLGLPRVSGLWSWVRTHLKKPCAILVGSMGRMTNTDFIPAVKLDRFGRTLLYKHFYFVYMFCLFNTFVPPILSFSVSSFWPLTGHNNLRILYHIK